MSGRKIPLFLKILFTAGVALWVPVYWEHYGPSQFLWFCDIANLVLLVGLWTESRLLFSWQAVSILLVQLAWTLDLAGYALFGQFPFGGAAYMVDPRIPPAVRLLSLFHAAVPVLLLWLLARVGYDRRALPVQVATAIVVLPLSFLFGPERDINWSWGPFDRPQSVLPPELYLALCVAGYPLLLYLPAHLALCRLFSARPRTARGGPDRWCPEGPASRP